MEDTKPTCNLLARQAEVSRNRLDPRGDTSWLDPRRDTSCAEVAGRESAEKRFKVRRVR